MSYSALDGSVIFDDVGVVCLYTEQVVGLETQEQIVDSLCHDENQQDVK
jgi:hypothetical protein